MESVGALARISISIFRKKTNESGSARLVALLTPPRYEGYQARSLFRQGRSVRAIPARMTASGPRRIWPDGRELVLVLLMVRIIIST